MIRDRRYTQIFSDKIDVSLSHKIIKIYHDVVLCILTLLSQLRIDPIFPDEKSRAAREIGHSIERPELSCQWHAGLGLQICRSPRNIPVLCAGRRKNGSHERKWEAS